MNNIERTKVQPGQVPKIAEEKGKPEVHIHTALTFIWAGDPMSLQKTKRNQQEIEIGQFAVALKYGLITNQALDQAFAEFKHIITERLRGSGALVQGE